VDGVRQRAQDRVRHELRAQGDDLTIMQLMRTVSIDASVLPTDVIGGGGGGTEGGQEADDHVGRGKIEVLVIAGEEMIV
jgi:hypothetical protein